MSSQKRGVYAEPDPIKIIFQGTAVPTDAKDPLGADEFFQVSKRYEIGTTTRGSLVKATEDLQEEVVGLTTNDGVEWYGLAQDLPELLAQPVPRSRGGINTFTLPVTVKSADPTRGFAGELLKSLFKIVPRTVKESLSPKELAKKSRKWSLDNIGTVADLVGEGVALPTGRKIDELLQPQPGLYHVTLSGQLGELARPVQTDQAMLIFLHGTFSSFEGGFAGMNKETWQAIHDAYKGQVYALDHRTITVSPVRNVLDLLTDLPDQAKIDLVTHSRGGLVGDVLARCDARLNDKAGYTKGEIATIRKEAAEVEKDWEATVGDIADMTTMGDEVISGLREEARRIIAMKQAHTDLAGEMEELTELIKGRTITVNRIIRVACPAAGTTLLTERMDHFLNAVLNVAKLATGGTLSTIIDLLRRLLVAVIDERRDPAIFPGIYAMVPDKGFSRINNAADVELPSELINVAGNTEVGGGLLKSLTTMLSNLYYWQANDFVVDTASMSRGMFKRKLNTTLTITNAQVAHSSYFNNRNHLKYILRLLLHGELGELGQTSEINYTETFYDRTDYGKLTDKAYELGKLVPAIVSGKKPIIVLLPGIMGSNLSVGGVEKWFQLSQLSQGALVNDLDVQAEVAAESVMSTYYKKLTDHLLLQKFDVRVFPFDWRLSLVKSAGHLRTELKELRSHGQPITILAHSMGGLLFRQFMFDYRGDWENLREEHSTKFIMLGTPWRGSHLITEVLTGYSKRIKQLALIDQNNTKRELLEKLNELPGIYELLPLDDDNLTAADWWEKQQSLVRSGDMPPLPDERLTAFGKFKNDVATGLTKFTALDWQRCYYVAGHSPETVDGYTRKFAVFLFRHVLKFTSTPKGDGSVTWKRGIPAELAKERVYYTGTDHGQLANDPLLFGGIMDLIRLGETKDSAFSRVPPVSDKRGTLSAAPMQIYRGGIPNAAPLDVIMGIDGVSPRNTPVEKVLNVEIYNGDLKWSQFPVLVGHFEQDGIVSAERAIDKYLGNILTERHQLGFYPGKIGEQEVIYDPDRHPTGAVVVGLGDKENLTSSALAGTVEKGILKYAIFLRDNKVKVPERDAGGLGISVLFLGSNYGEIPLRESIRSILLGIRDANLTIESFNATRQGRRLLPIDTVEFVDYYEDRAYEGFKSLQDLVKRKAIPNLNISHSIKDGFGKRKRFLRDGSRSWWQTFTTTVNQDGGKGKERLEFSTSNRGAAFSREFVDSNLGQVRLIADAFSTNEIWNPKYAKALFELLIPNRYKDFIRNHRNMIWRMDTGAAAFPWEMFHDTATGQDPTFVRAGMIRQLLDEDAPVRPLYVRNNSCLVIGNSEFGGALPELPSAKVEAQLVVDKLTARKFNVTPLINANPVHVLTTLYPDSYKIIHIASHGHFDPEGSKDGISLGADFTITAGELKQLSTIPELVFVNCCYMGTVDSEWENYYQGRNKLAANIGTQLIRNGVKAVVVAGWAVDDAAALTFAEVFYDNILAGDYFGESVRKARKACYKAYPHTNTWGAYQCYGDPFYQADPTAAGSGDDTEISLKQEIILALDNLISRATTIKGDVPNEVSSIRSDVAGLMRRVGELDITDYRIIEREADVYNYLGDYPTARDRYNKLFELDDGQYKTISYLNYLAIDARHAFWEHVSKGKKNHTRLVEIARKMDGVGMAESPRLAETMIADVYKRAAGVGTPKQSVTSARRAAEGYRKAAASWGFDTPSAIYAATEFISLSAYTNAATREKTGKQIDVQASLGQSVAAYFEDTTKLLAREGKDRNSLFSARSEFSLALSKLVHHGFSGDLPISELSRLSNKVVQAHKNQITHCLNQRDVDGQAQEMKLLQKFCSLLGEKYAPLNKLFTEIEKAVMEVIK